VHGDATRHQYRARLCVRQHQTLQNHIITSHDLTNSLTCALHRYSMQGFVRMAMRHGTSIVPVYVFGNTKLFNVAGGRVGRFAIVFLFVSPLDTTVSLVAFAPERHTYLLVCIRVRQHQTVQSCRAAVSVSLISFFHFLIWVCKLVFCVNFHNDPCFCPTE
jgi:hypothetical protein